MHKTILVHVRWQSLLLLHYRPIAFKPRRHRCSPPPAHGAPRDTSLPNPCPLLPARLLRPSGLCRCRSLAPRVPLLPWRSSRRAQEAPSSQWRTFFVWTLRAKRGGWSRSGGMPTCTALRRMSIRSLLGDWYSMFRSAQSTITTWMETSTHSKVKRLRRQRSIAA
jgi:hypothetical protein